MGGGTEAGTLQVYECWADPKGPSVIMVNRAQSKDVGTPVRPKYIPYSIHHLQCTIDKILCSFLRTHLFKEHTYFKNIPACMYIYIHTYHIPTWTLRERRLFP